MEEANPLHHVKTNLHSGAKVETHFEGSVEVSGEARHDEEDNGIGAIRVVIIDQCSHEVHNPVILGEGPVRGRREEGGGTREERGR